MILQALNEYYERKSTEPESPMAPTGFEWKEIPYIIVLNPDGIPVNIESTYEGEGKKRRARSVLIPKAVKKTSGISSNLLWDNPEYVLGIPTKGKPERVCEQHKAFIDRVGKLDVPNDEGLAAVKNFLNLNEKVDLLKSLGEILQTVINDNGNISFRLSGDNCIISERSAIKKAISKTTHIANGIQNSICLVTGHPETIERLHPTIKGVYGAQTAGANIVSFNLDAFKSYGKAQGANAPVGVEASFKYTTALNHLLSKDSKQRMQVGEASTVFWAEKPDDLEQQIPDIFGEPRKDDPDRNVKAVASLFKSIENGAYHHDTETPNRFYVLGLSPNAARIAIRFWIVDSVQGIAEKISQHFNDAKIIHGPKQKDVLSLFRLLVSTAVQGKSENIPPNIAGETMRAILQGLPYPYSLLQAAIRRIRAEHEVTYPRASLIKACINRSTRLKNLHIKEELHMSLDETNTNIGYRLGRLFATLEKIQQEANPGINATIRDRFYGAASGTPSTVFGNLMRLKNHHLAKLESTGRRIYFEKLLGQIIDGVEASVSFPSHLSLEDQGRFAIGYYHQVQKFFTKKTDKE